MGRSVATTAAAALAALAALTGRAVAQPAACGAGGAAQALVQQPNSWCRDMGEATNLVELDTCCAAPAGGDVRRALLKGSARSLQSYGEDAMCRTVTTDAAYCHEDVSPGCSDMLGAKDSLTIRLAMTATNTQEAQCCQTCQCIGDPSCISFDGTHDEWVLCDSRTNDCGHSEQRCHDQTDHAGNACLWLKDTPEWHSVSRNGSPCQPDFANSGYPTMNMYSADDFHLHVKLGERGIIIEAEVQTADGTWSMSSDDCFKYNPRSSGNPGRAWKGQGQLPNGWTVHTPNEVEILWRVYDTSTGITSDIVCTMMQERTRIDIRQVIEPSLDRIDNGEGFCASGTISDKQGTTAYTSQIWGKCLEKNAPNMLVACKHLVDMSCTRYNMNAKIDKWCENADLARTSAAGASSSASIQACKDMLKNGKHKKRREAWTQLVCEANGMEVTSCMDEVSQFGWADFLTSHSDGMVDQGNSVNTCESNPENYGTQTNSCESGVSIEYQTADGEWHQAMFVPSTRQPCNNELVVTADKYKELFIYPIRISQCSGDASCLASNECLAAAGFEASFSFETEDCPTLAPTPSPTVCSTAVEQGNALNPVDVNGQYNLFGTMEIFGAICKEGPSNVMQLGCDSTELVNVYFDDCETTLNVKVATESGFAMCSSGELPLNTEVSYEIQVTGTYLALIINDEEVCRENFPSNVHAVVGNNQCIYTSSPNYPAAQVCLTVNFLTTDLFEVCEYDSPQHTICQPPPQSDQVGSCESICPALSDLISDDNGDRCRYITMPQPYCDEDVHGSKFCNKKLKNKDGELTITLTVDQSSNMQCCQTCSCYGDPECIAFDGSIDIWLLCDARDTDCLVQESLCSEQLDHKGRKCVWDKDRADSLLLRSDIGAVGSPCQANWEESGYADMVMYKRRDFQASITMGERGVIETLELEVPKGVYTLVADDCFSNMGGNAWHMSDNAAPLMEAFNITATEGPGPDQRTMTIAHLHTGVFIRAVCLRRTSSNGKYTNARLNIQSLVETSDASQTGQTSGYCTRPESVIPKGDSTYQRSEEIHEQCLQTFQTPNLLCRAITDTACSASDVPKAAADWCAQANLYPNNPNRVQMCLDKIKPNSNDLKAIANAWTEMYCLAVSNQAHLGSQQEVWVRQCVSRMQTDGYDRVVNEYGDGTFSSAVNDGQCGSSADSYGARKSADLCGPGIAIEYQDSKGEWIEELFIPLNLLPCNNQVTVSAKDHINLFRRPIRFTQCATSLDKCDADVSCMPMYEYTVNLAFSEDESMCN